MKSQTTLNWVTLVVSFIIVAMFVCTGVSTAVKPRYVPPEGIYGKVTDAVTGDPIIGATVSGGGDTDETDANGNYWLSIPYAGGHYVSVYDKEGFDSDGKTVYISSYTGFGVGNFQLTHVASIWGYTEDESDNHIGNQYISVNWNPLLATYSDENGFYYMQPSSQGYYYLDSSMADHFIIEDWCVWYPSGGTVHTDLVFETDKLKEVTIFAMFVTVNTQHTSCWANFTTSQMTTATVTAYAPGSSYTDSKTTTLSQTWGTHNDPCLVLKREVWISGEVGHIGDGENGLRDCYVKSWRNYINLHDDINDYMDESEINPDSYPSTKAGGGEVTPGDHWTISKRDSESVSYSTGLKVSVPIGSLGMNIELGGSLTAAESWANEYSITVRNNDGSTHDFKWFFEGTSSTLGMILHVWEVS